MYKKAFLIAVLFTFCIPAYMYCQDLSPKEFQQHFATLQKNIPDTNTVNSLHKLTLYYIDKMFVRNTYDSALLLQGQSEKLSKELHFSAGLEKSYLDRIDLLQRFRNIKVSREREDGSAQLAQIKEVEKQLIDKVQSSGDNKKLAQTYIDLGDSYVMKENDSKHILALYQSGLAIFSKNGYKKEEAETYMQLGILYKTHLGNLVEAEKYFLKCLELSSQYDKLHAYKAQNMLGNTYTLLGNYKLGLQHGIEAEKGAYLAKDTSAYMGTLFSYLGVTSEAVVNYPKALDYYKKAFESEKKFGNKGLMINAASNMGKIMLMTDPKASIDFLEGILEKYPLPPTHEMNVTMFNRLITASLKLGNYDKAKIYSNKLIELSKRYPTNSPKQIFTVSPIIRYYMATKQYQLAQPYITIYNTVVQERKIVPYMAEIYRWNFEIDTANKNYPSAIVNYKMYKIMSDSVSNLEKTKEYARLQTLYETEKKDKEILLKAKDIDLLTKKGELQSFINERQTKDLELKEKDIVLLTQQQELQAAEADKKNRDLLLKDNQIKIKEQDITLLKQQDQLQKANLKEANTTRNIIIAGGLLSLLFLALLYNRYRVKQRANKEINSKNLALQGLVNEKEWLLKEVHHRVKNNLQTVVSLLESQSIYLQNNEALLAIQDSQNRVYAMSLIHQKLYQAENVAAIDMGAYLPELTEYLRDSFDIRHQVYFKIDIPNLELDVSQAIPIGLIVNEAVTNSIKYAFPNDQLGKRIEISMTLLASDMVTLHIADNGIGLPSSFTTDNNNGLGVSLMKGLTDDINGSFVIESNNGTSIMIRFLATKPLPKVGSENVSTLISRQA